ncbi:MAG: protein kinase [Rubrivivax sp.]|nr:protein kinase [Rubrivivax sp.]
MSTHEGPPSRSGGVGMADDPEATVRRPWPLPRPDENRDHTTVVRPRSGGGAATATWPLAPAREGPADAPEPTDATDATEVLRTRVEPRTEGATGPESTWPGPVPAALPRRQVALDKGVQLHEYRIERVLGQGGFGITYLATDVNLDALVAVKEYLPEEIAFRATDQAVSPNSSTHLERYRQGLDNFLTEARTLASFRHPNIVRVARFFEANSTAYMVLELERGRSFKKWWARQLRDGALSTGGTTAGERLLVERLQPLLDGLSMVHDAGYLHRDIKPDNIQVRADDGRFVLLDFGSAGQAVALADQDAVIVTPGYAPIEQYGLGEQGAWTDIYALAATLYWAVAGRKPPDAEARSGGMRLVPAAEVGRGRFGQSFLDAIDWALEMDPARRPRSVAAWSDRLLADHKALLRGGALGERFEVEPPASARPAPWKPPAELGWKALLPRHWSLATRITALVLAAGLVPALAVAAWLLAGQPDPGRLPWALALLALAVALGAARWARRWLLPLQAATMALKAQAAGRWDHARVAEVPRPRELARVARAVNALAELHRQRAADRSQRR